MSINVAIDGPAGTGKGTVTKLVSEELGLVNVDTGAMYRCVAYYGLTNGYDLDDASVFEELLTHVHIELNGSAVILNGEDVSAAIRQDEVSKNASKVAIQKAVREFLVARQREMASIGGVILDGRDIGTVVLPDAELKIYQIASVEARARRRYKENISKGFEADLETIKKDIESRDYNDMNRKESPLKKADDAIELDTSDLSIDEVLEKIMALVEEKIK